MTGHRQHGHHHHHRRRRRRTERRLRRRRIVVAASLVVAAVICVGAAWWYLRPPKVAAAAVRYPDPAVLEPYTIVVAGIDSLTDGAGGSSWRTYYREAALPGTGDGGPGWAGFTARGAEDQGATLQRVGFREFGITADQGAFSLNGEGITVDSPRATSFTWSMPSRWLRARIFYLVEPEGGTITCAGRRPVAINTAGPSRLGWADIEGPGTLRCANGRGRLTFFGAIFTSRPSGLLMVNMARSGRRLSQVAGQDSSFRAQWFAALMPDWFILNGGANDWRDDTPMSHKTDLRTVIQDALAGHPDVRTLLVQHNAAGGSGGIEGEQRLMDNGQAKQELANELRIPLVDVADLLGPYGAARANGLIMDSVHPSDAGNRLIGPWLVRQTLGRGRP